MNMSKFGAHNSYGEYQGQRAAENTEVVRKHFESRSEKWENLSESPACFRYEAVSPFFALVRPFQGFFPFFHHIEPGATSDVNSEFIPEEGLILAKCCFKVAARLSRGGQATNCLSQVQTCLPSDFSS
jgi:hypothetical protein